MDTKHEKISIIVPVYNVRDYLERCIKSITAQTYKNIEIILVDDGSTDGSEQLCDELAAQDNRIVVVHKKNGGAADARNVGLDIASGELIAFVDSDDYIEATMYETLYRYLQYDVDMVSCGMKLKELNGNIHIVNAPSETITYSGEQALSNMLDIKHQIVGCAVCNKLYRIENFDQLRFRKGIIGEDIEILYQLYADCNKMVCIPDALYWYDKREGSVTTCVFSSKNLDMVDIAQNIEVYVKKKFPHLLSDAYVYELMWLLSAYKSWFYSPSREAQYEVQIRKRVNEVSEWLRYNGGRKNKKRYASMLCLAMTIKWHCYSIVRVILGRNNG